MLVRSALEYIATSNTTSSSVRYGAYGLNDTGCPYRRKKRIRHADTLVDPPQRQSIPEARASAGRHVPDCRGLDGMLLAALGE